MCALWLPFLCRPHMDRDKVFSQRNFRTELCRPIEIYEDVLEFWGSDRNSRPIPILRGLFPYFWHNYLLRNTSQIFATINSKIFLEIENKLNSKNEMIRFKICLTFVNRKRNKIFLSICFIKKCFQKNKKKLFKIWIYEINFNSLTIKIKLLTP